ncbi:hypothetical protein ADIAG_01610 [Paeniglutamicibacter gangotriensis Lz1y]|uniref:Uncharacterized protein n=1 Tax=Paeniglutamicibacter gangotriensis Lz1y TaxID=1276920 RepID=M7MR49_9MICC|nr:hypothetical protein ADIAG_01610 [Paeniglutamicibacter gangotriensis Lz1y]
MTAQIPELTASPPRGGVMTVNLADAFDAR